MNHEDLINILGEAIRISADRDYHDLKNTDYLFRWKEVLE